MNTTSQVSAQAVDDQVELSWQFVELIDELLLVAQEATPGNQEEASCLLREINSLLPEVRRLHDAGVHAFFRRLVKDRIGPYVWLGCAAYSAVLWPINAWRNIIRPAIDEAGESPDAICSLCEKLAAKGVLDRQAFGEIEEAIRVEAAGASSRELALPLREGSESDIRSDIRSDIPKKAGKYRPPNKAALDAARYFKEARKKGEPITHGEAAEMANLANNDQRGSSVSHILKMLEWNPDLMA